jgi:hypothetical protein
MAKTNIDITATKTPATDSNFSEKQIDSIIGPIPILPPNVSLESHAIQPLSPKNAAVWNPLTTFEDGLKAALIDFVDTTMEGVKYSKNFAGRKKVIDFFYYGTATKSVAPSEIGHFSLVFSYPPNTINAANK